jgi:hypothetical protein
MRISLLAMLTAASLSAQGPARTFTGVVTDTMCGADHSHMGVSPDSKCVKECVKGGGGKWRYALLVDGKKIYVLSDQQTPEKFAAQKVSVTGVLYKKTGILKVDSMAAAR